MKYNFGEIGNRIRILRKTSGKNQDDFIETLNNYGINIGRNRLSLIENGDRNHFSLDILLAVCEIFNCDMGYLLGEYNEKTRELHEISAITGLSETAIKKLQVFKSENRKTAHSDLLSILIENDNAEYFLAMIEKRISYHAKKKGLVGNALVKNMIERTMHLDIDGTRSAVYKDTLIDSLLQTEFIKLLPIISDEYLNLYSETPDQRYATWNVFSRDLAQQELRGEITTEQHMEKINNWFDESFTK